MEHVVPPASAVVTAIANVMKNVGAVEKRGKNKFHDYAYATSADLLHKLQPIMAAEGLVVFQTEMGRSFIRQDTVLLVDYEFTIAHRSGEVWPEKIRRTGLAAATNTKGGFDDKALNKANTSAHKYFLLNLFEIPTGDFEEADGDEDVAPPKTRTREETKAPPQEEAPKAEALMDPVDDIIIQLETRKTAKGVEALRKHPTFIENFRDLDAAQKRRVNDAEERVLQRIADEEAARHDPDTGEIRAESEWDKTKRLLEEAKAAASQGRAPDGPPKSQYADQLEDDIPF